MKNLMKRFIWSYPRVFFSTKPNQVCRLTKSLYGLKQASRQWFAKLSASLVSLGFISSPSDHSLFIKNIGSSFTTLLVYVDDVILAGNSLIEITNVKQYLDSTFKIKNHGQLKYFLGLEVARSKKGIHLCQCKYALDILSDSGLLAAKPCSTPMLKNNEQSFIEGDPFDRSDAYSRLIGRILDHNTTWHHLCYPTLKLIYEVIHYSSSSGSHTDPSLHQRFPFPRLTLCNRFLLTAKGLYWLRLGFFPQTFVA